MNTNTLSQGEPWMTPEERQLNHDFVHTTTEHLAARGVPETPLLLIRINDVIATWLLARRLEAALTPEPGEPAPCPTPAQAGAIGKCRDRLRRAMKELEACCPPDATPVAGDLLHQQPQPAKQTAAPAPPAESAHETATCPDEVAREATATTPTQRCPENAETNPAPTAAIPPQHAAPIDVPPAPSPPTCEKETGTDTTGPAKPYRERQPTKKRHKKRGCPRRTRSS